MTTILFVTTLVLNFTGALFACIYLGICFSSDFIDSEARDRRARALSISKRSAIIAIVFAFLTCLLTKSSQITQAIAITASLYSILSITWLAMILICGIASLLTVVSKKFHTSCGVSGIKKVFVFALIVSIICLILTWLFY